MFLIYYTSFHHDLMGLSTFAFLTKDSIKLVQITEAKINTFLPSQYLLISSKNQSKLRPFMIQIIISTLDISQHLI